MSALPATRTDHQTVRSLMSGTGTRMRERRMPGRIRVAQDRPDALRDLLSKNFVAALRGHMRMGLTHAVSYLH